MSHVVTFVFRPYSPTGCLTRGSTSITSTRFSTANLELSSRIYPCTTGPCAPDCNTVFRTASCRSVNSPYGDTDTWFLARYPRLPTSTPPCFRSLTSIGPTLQDRSRAHTVRVTAPTSWQLWAKPCLMQPYSVLPWTGSTPSWLLPGSEQCRRPKCRERGNHLNHSHDSCRFKDASTRHHNLGRAPEKKVKHASSSSGGKNKTQTYKPKPTAPQASSGATPTRKRLCYI